MYSDFDRISGERMISVFKTHLPWVANHFQIQRVTFENFSMLSGPTFQIGTHFWKSGSRFPSDLALPSEQYRINITKIIMIGPSTYIGIFVPVCEVSFLNCTTTLHLAYHYFCLSICRTPSIAEQWVVEVGRWPQHNNDLRKWIGNSNYLSWTVEIKEVCASVARW